MCVGVYVLNPKLSSVAIWQQFWGGHVHCPMSIYCVATPWAFCKPVHRCSIIELSAWTLSSDWAIKMALRVKSCPFSLDLRGDESADAEYRSRLSAFSEATKLACAVVSLSRANRILVNCGEKNRFLWLEINFMQTVCTFDTFVQLDVKMMPQWRRNLPNC